ncbi:MAG TPA: hypothetical protein VLL25_09875 [Acidimicrobiales bacterium]|nr:hypothetical protein [Acidimicrobiales bacterium]
MVRIVGATLVVVVVATVVDVVVVVDSDGVGSDVGSAAVVEAAPVGALRAVASREGVPPPEHALTTSKSAVAANQRAFIVISLPPHAQCGSQEESGMHDAGT